MEKIEIINGRIIDPANNVDVHENLYIADGKIVSRNQKRLSDFNPDRVIDANKLIISPGFIDLSASLGNLDSSLVLAKRELDAAVANGITTLCIPPQPSDLFQTALGIEWLISHCKNISKIKLYPFAALTHHLAGTQLNELASLKDAGCIAVTNDRFAINNTEVKRRCYEYAGCLDLKLFIYPLDNWLSKGSVHEGEISTRLGLKGIPSVAEISSIAQELMLLEDLGISAHFCRLSTAGSLKLLQTLQSKQNTADAAAHQLLLTEQNIGDFDSTFHVYPPLRGERDRVALQQGLQENLLDALCSHHEPVTKMAKYAPFPETTPGMSTVDSLLGQVLRIRDDINSSLITALGWITSRPANILGLSTGNLSSGTNADICIFDPSKSWTQTTETIKSFGLNSPFLHWDFLGQVKYTLISGEIVYQNLGT